MSDYAHDIHHPTFNSAKCTVCQECGKVGPVYQSSATERWVGIECLPDEDIDRYPGWRQRILNSRTESK